MKKFRLMSILMIATLSVGARTVESFNNGWEFAKDGGAFEYARVPHDWAIAGPFDPEGDGDTAKLPWKGMGVYRKKLVMAEEPKGRVFLDFDGVLRGNPV
ncbi:MAG TPA: hypothetical protein PLM57_14690, partial [Candidatus Latescibacteria bacterium]|nr:hypothetical protein [Candidatus Latescibacterota bacterium]